MKLEAYLESVRVNTFDWAKWNCCHLAAGWVKANEGHDPLAGLDLPATKTDVLRLLASGALPDRVTTALGRTPVSHYLAYVGDLVYVPTKKNSGGIIAICNGVSAVTLLIGGGYWTKPMEEASMAWKIKQ